jgi:hypothetical protein
VRASAQEDDNAFLFLGGLNEKFTQLGRATVHTYCAIITENDRCVNK